MNIQLRPIEQRDEINLAVIIRAALIQFNVPKVGTVYSDPTTDELYKLFSTSGSCYFVAEADNILFGGCGIYPTEGLPEGCAELVKLYLSADARGKGIGKILLEKSFTAARDSGYTQLYLESFPQMDMAVSMYIKAGFTHINHPLGNSGHHACTIWMVKDLS